MSDSAQTGLGPETLSLIRDMVSGEGGEEAPAAPRASALRKTPETARPRVGAASPDVLSRAIAKVRAFRPSRRQIIWSSIALVVLIWPALVVLALVLSIFTVIGVFLACGSDRVWSGAVRLLKWYMARAPERGASLAVRLDRFALRWDNFLDRFPDGWVDGLYLPDLQSLLEADDRHDAVMATRLQRLQEQTADKEAAA